MPDLLSILASSDPQAAQLLAASQGAQLQNAAIDPNFGHNEGLFGALAKTLAGFRGGGMVNDALPQIIAARQAALPEQAKLYASDDPLKELAGGGYSPTTLAMALSGMDPTKAAEAKLKAAQVAGLNASTALSGRLGGLPPSAGGQIGPVGVTPIPKQGLGGAAPQRQGGAAAAPSAVPQDYNPRPPSSDAGAADPLTQVSTLPPSQRPAALQALQAQQKAALAAKYRAFFLQQQQQRVRQASPTAAPPA